MTTRSTRCCRSSTACSTSWPGTRSAPPTRCSPRPRSSGLYRTDDGRAPGAGAPRRRRHAADPHFHHADDDPTDVRHTCSPSTSCTPRCSPQRSSLSSRARSRPGGGPRRVRRARHRRARLHRRGRRALRGLEPVLGVIGGSHGRDRVRRTRAARARARQRHRRRAGVRPGPRRAFIRSIRATRPRRRTCCSGSSSA